MRAEIRFIGSEAQRALGKVASIGNEAKGFQNLAKIVASTFELIALTAGLHVSLTAVATAASQTKRFYRLALKPVQLLNTLVGKGSIWQRPGATMLDKAQVTAKAVGSLLKIVDTPVIAGLRSVAWLPLSVGMLQARFAFSMVNSALKVHKLVNKFQLLKRLISETKAIHGRWKEFKGACENESSDLELKHKKYVLELKGEIGKWIDSYKKKNQKGPQGEYTERVKGIVQDMKEEEQDSLEVHEKLRSSMSNQAKHLEGLDELVILCCHLEHASVAYYLATRRDQSEFFKELKEFYKWKIARQESALARYLHERKVTLIDGGRQVSQIALSALGLAMSFINPVAAGVVLLVHECASGVFGLTKFLYHGRRKDVYQNA